MKTLEECLELAKNEKEAIELYIEQHNWPNNQKTQSVIISLKNELKTMKKTPEEKKEIAHRIIKIILEVLLQIITMGLPMLTKGKTILKIK